jgi:acetylglutamate kinase
VAIIVVKLGGELLAPAGAAEARAIADDIAALQARGARLLIVHGGGPQTTELSRRLGIEPQIVAGRRVTDAAALQVVEWVVAGQVNLALCALLVRAGVRPVGLHGASGPALRAHKRPPRVVAGGPAQPIDFGHVGDVDGFDLALLELLYRGGYVPVLACVGCNPQTGERYNINADVVASRLAAALPDAQLLLVTGAPGVLADAKDPESRFPRLTRAEGERAIAEGRISGGMLPKLEEAFAALRMGVAAVHVVGRLGAGDLARAVESPGSIGTVLIN